MRRIRWDRVIIFGPIIILLIILLAVTALKAVTPNSACCPRTQEILQDLLSDTGSQPILFYDKNANIDPGERNSIFLLIRNPYLQSRRLTLKTECIGIQRGDEGGICRMSLQQNRSDLYIEPIGEFVIGQRASRVVRLDIGSKRNLTKGVYEVKISFDEGKDTIASDYIYINVGARHFTRARDTCRLIGEQCNYYGLDK